MNICVPEVMLFEQYTNCNVFTYVGDNMSFHAMKIYMTFSSSIWAFRRKLLLHCFIPCIHNLIKTQFQFESIINVSWIDLFFLYISFTKSILTTWILHWLALLAKLEKKSYCQNLHAELYFCTWNVCLVSVRNLSYK